MKTLHHSALLLGIVFAAALLMQGCKKETDSATDPTLHKPDRVVVTASKDTVLTDGRDSSLLSFQLYRAGQPFQQAFSIIAMTELGFFKQGTGRVRRTEFTTDASGKTSVFFYGDFDPGFDRTLIWGDGFGVDTVRTVFVIGPAHLVTLYFRDPLGSTWGSTDTLKAGSFRGKADSTFVRVSVRDKNNLPLPSVRVDLEVLVNGVRALASRYGYFKTAAKPDSVATGLVYTDAQGEAFDTFYSDDYPNFGKKVIEIAAQVEVGTFGRIAVSKFLVIAQ